MGGVSLGLLHEHGGTVVQGLALLCGEWVQLARTPMFSLPVCEHSGLHGQLFPSELTAAFT